MTRLDTRPRPTSVLHALPTVGRCAGAVAALALALVGISLLDIPPIVPKLTVINPGAYQVNVEVGGAERDGWTDLGAVERESTKTLEEVNDQGQTWVFHFSYAGVEAGDTAVAASALRRGGWKITVPDEVTGRLRGAGLPPSAQ